MTKCDIYFFETASAFGGFSQLDPCLLAMARVNDKGRKQINEHDN